MLAIAARYRGRTLDGSSRCSLGIGHSAVMACGWLRSSEAAHSSVEWACTIPRAGRNRRLRGHSPVRTGDGVTPAERLGERFERNLIVRGHEVRLYAIERGHWRVD